MEKNVQIYLVGGAVRDQLLGHPYHERDWVVVGATPEWMLAQGFRAVGKDFPVFIHPTTGEEYALARTERKTAPGYTGFVFHAAPDVSLEQDLCRRDLTINAMAQNAQGELIDPYHGQQDLQARILRHVSAAFVEDPVRILRVARFLARYHRYGFSVAAETLQLMQHMVQHGEVQALTAERVWQELQRALGEDYPRAFFTSLQGCGALSLLFPCLEQNTQALGVLDAMCAQSQAPILRFAALFAAATADKAELQQLVQRYRIPNAYSQLAQLAQQHRRYYPDVLQATAAELLAFLEKADGFRQPQRLLELLEVLRAIHGDSDTVRSDRLQHAYRVASAVAVADVLQAGFTGQAIATELQRRRIAALAEQIAVSSRSEGSQEGHTGWPAA